MYALVAKTDDGPVVWVFATEIEAQTAYRQELSDTLGEEMSLADALDYYDSDEDMWIVKVEN